MPSLPSRARRRALTFSRSFVSAIKRHFTCSLFSKPKTTYYPPYKPLPNLPPQPNPIGRPRQLRRPPPSLSTTPSYRRRQHYIQHLPVEIIAHIFVLGAESDIHLPIAVSHVCRAWRYIALRTPSLWRLIALTPNELMWKERIRRARACALDIQLFPYTRSPRTGARRPLEMTPYTVQWYMHLVLPYIHRWRTLEIYFTDRCSFLWRAALSGCSVPASMLQELSLRYRGNDDVQEFTLFSGHAPLLRRLTVDGLRLTWLPSLFGNLSYLDYTHHGFTNGHQAVHDVISLLSVSSRLTELKIFFPRGQVARLPSRRRNVNRRVMLPELTHLHLIADGSDIPFELAHLVTLFDTPSLTHLYLIDLGRSRESFPSLKSFFYVYPLPRALKYVHVAYGWYDPRMIQPMANSLPVLRKIGVKRYHSPEQMLSVRRRTMTRQALNQHHYHQPGSHQPRPRSINRNSLRYAHTGSRSQRRHSGQYRIDQLNVQYIPSAFKER